jgi:hypothetical protein
MTKYEACESRLSNLLAMLDDQDLTLETRFEILSEIFALQKEEIDELKRKLKAHEESPPSWVHAHEMTKEELKHEAELEATAQCISCGDAAD